MISDQERPVSRVPDVDKIDDTPITTVLRQHPLPDAVAHYEEWLKEIIPVAQSFAGHQSVSVIRPHKTDDPYTIILHFDTVAHLRDWLDSETRVHLVQKVRPFLQTDEDVDIKTGFKFWFTPPPASRPAKPYKQFLITLSAIFPLTVAVPWLLQPLFQWAPLLGLPGASRKIWRRVRRSSWAASLALIRSAAMSLSTCMRSISLRLIAITVIRPALPNAATTRPGE